VAQAPATPGGVGIEVGEWILKNKKIGGPSANPLKRARSTNTRSVTAAPVPTVGPQFIADSGEVPAVSILIGFWSARRNGITLGMQDLRSLGAQRSLRGLVPRQLRRFSPVNLPVEPSKKPAICRRLGRKRCSSYCHSVEGKFYRAQCGLAEAIELLAAVNFPSPAPVP